MESFSATDGVIVGTKTPMNAGPTGRTLELESSIFCPNVRCEWINAMFGPDFFASPDYVPRGTGVGLSRIPSYVCYEVKINPLEAEEDAKLGVTISRIPLGVYVRGVDVDGEAYSAGIIPGSVLISINDVGVLGDPTHKLLEKLWWYEGHCSAHQRKDNDKESSGGSKTGPVALKLIKDGVLYTAILLGKSPFGISWAPCGNFALVQRTYSHAQKAGVRKGCLVAAINGQSLRDMDHEQTAAALRDSFASKQTIKLTCCYTPSDSRSGSTSKSGDKKLEQEKTQRENNGVRLRRTENPSGYGVGSFFTCGTKKAYIPLDSEKNIPANPDSIAELAVQVAAGNLAAPTGQKRTLSYSNTAKNMSFREWADEAQNKCKDKSVALAKHFQTIGAADPRQKEPLSLDFDQVILQWDPLDALLFCLSRHRVSYNEEAWIAEGGVIGKSKDKILFSPVPKKSNGFNERLIPLHTIEANKEIIKSYCTNDNVDMLGMYSLQFICLLSTVDLCKSILRKEKTVRPATNEGEHDEAENKKQESKRIKTTLGIAEKTIVDIFEPIISISLQNGDFCQKLHYLMRSFTESMKEYNTTIQSKSFYSPLQVLENIQQQFVTELRGDENSTNDGAHHPKRAGVPILDTNGSMGDHSSWGGSSRIMQVETIDDGVSTKSFGIDSQLSNISSLSINGINKKTNGNETAPLKFSSDSNSKNEQLDEQNELNTTKKKSKSKLKKLMKGVGVKKSKKSGKNSTKKEEPPHASNSTKSSLASQRNSNSSENPRSIANLKTKGQSQHIETRASAVPKPNSILKKGANPEPTMISNHNVLPMYLRINQSFSMIKMFDRMDYFLKDLSNVCEMVENNLQKSISQKLAQWVMQPWSPSKDRALANVTGTMRKALDRVNSKTSLHSTQSQDYEDKSDVFPLLDPLNSKAKLLSLVPEECHILPTAHFPLLLSFNAFSRSNESISRKASSKPIFWDEGSTEILYRTKVEFLTVKVRENNETNRSNDDFIVHAAIGGQIQETDKSNIDPYFGSRSHRWQSGKIMNFESRSRWGSPRTLSLRVSSVSDESVLEPVSYNGGSGKSNSSVELGYSFIDLKEIWEKSKRIQNASNGTLTESYVAKVFSFERCDFDQHGYPHDNPDLNFQGLEVDLKVTVQSIPTGISRDDGNLQNFLEERRLLLFKHDDDLRQEMFAIQFIGICDRILRATGLDLKLKQYSCIPVGKNSGFIEWVSGTVPMSEICKPLGSALFNGDAGFAKNTNYNAEDCDEVGEDREQPPFSTRSGGWCKYESLRSLRQYSNKSDHKDHIGLNGNNPVQDFLRAHAYDPDAPYFICQEVMDNFVKSCAGYCIITYILGVGDRHLENLLIHQNGYFLHCDYSFILGKDPKTYLPMRITEEMVNGMGGFDSDNFSKFTSLVGAAFVALRQHSSVRILMSSLRNLSYSDIPDVSRNQNPYEAMNFLRNQFRLDLDEDDAISFIENLIMENVASKLWIAVDSIHSLNKLF